MAKTKRTKKPKTGTIPPDVQEAIDEAAAEIAAETNLTKSQAADLIMGKLQSKADASVADVDKAADKVEDEEKRDEDESEDPDESQDPDESEDEDESKDEDEDEDEDDGNGKDEKPPASHWSDRPLFGKRR